MKIIFGTAFVLMLIGCSTNKKGTSWESEHSKVSFNYNDPWTILPTMDTKDKTISGVIDMKDGRTYIIQVDVDIPKTELSDENFYIALKINNINANAKNKFIKEDDLPFHGETFHRQIFYIHNKKWGIQKQLNYGRRTGKKYYSVTMAFPSKENDTVDLFIPSELIEFDKGVKIEGK